MPARKATFPQADLVRALKGAAAAGMQAGRVEVRLPDGTVIVMYAAGETGGSENANDNANSCDRLLP